MSGNINPFGSSSDIDISASMPVTKQCVDQMFLDQQYDTESKCLICGNTAVYRLVPKKDIVNTAEIQDRGYVCKHCLYMKYIDPNNYGIKEI